MGWWFGALVVGGRLVGGFNKTLKNLWLLEKYLAFNFRRYCETSHAVNFSNISEYENLTIHMED